MTAPEGIVHDHLQITILCARRIFNQYSIGLQEYTSEAEITTDHSVGPQAYYLGPHS